MIAATRMRKPVITIRPTDPLAHAKFLMEANRIRHLPVVEAERLVGILSSRDIRVAAPPPAAPDEAHAETLLGMPVADVMTHEVVAVAPFTPIEHCARLMTEYKIGCLPVLAAGRLEGILTTTDVLATMAEMMGVTVPGSRLEVEVPAHPGTLGHLASAIEEWGARIASIASVPAGGEGRLTLVLRVQTINPGPLIQALTAAGYRVTAPERAA